MAINEAIPDFIGFVFAESRRRVDEERAAFLKSFLNPSIKAVGVFVNDDIDRIARLCLAGVIDLVQLHGDEDEDYIKRLKELVPNGIIKAVRVKAASDITKAVSMPCDFLLLDSYHEKRYGGTGNLFDWSMVPRIPKPFFLAGGINHENAARAIETLNPYAVDVSSGVETDGLKDPEKIKKIVALVRGFHHA